MTRLARLAVPIVVALGCAGALGDEERAAAIRDALVPVDAPWRSRDPGAVAEKYAAMARDPYDFMRGSAPLFYADIGREGGGSAGLGEGYEAQTILIVGDPHPENLGTMLPGDTAGPHEGQPPPRLLLEWNDLDGTTWGPWTLDLRRAALGLLAATVAMDGCERACRGVLAQRLTLAYTRGIATAREGAEPRSQLDGGRAWTDLLDEALEEGAERKQLRKRTQVRDGTRSLKVRPALDEDGKGMVEPTREDARRIARILAGWADSPEGFRVLDTARRYGQGVSSRPALRYIVLFDSGSPRLDDDELLNCREIGAPPVLAPSPSAAVPFDSEADRLAAGRRHLWSRPDADGRAFEARAGDDSFKCRRWSSYQQGFDHDKLARAFQEGDLDERGLRQLAEILGASLATAHARSRTPDGKSAIDAISADLDRHPPGLPDRITEAALRDLDRLLADHVLFRDLLVTHGPGLRPDLH